MRLGHGLRRARHGPGGSATAVEEIELDAIGQRRLVAAIVREQPVGSRLGQEVEEADIVVAGKRR